MKTKVFNIVLITVLLHTALFAQKNPPGPQAFNELRRLESMREEINSKVSEKLSKSLAKLNGLEKFSLSEFQVPSIEIPELPCELPYQEGSAGISIERSKTVVREYKVDGNDKLLLNNQFGNVTVNVWNNNSVKVEIEIKAFERTDERAEELLQSVSISESKETNLISFTTNITRENRNGDWWGIRRSNGVTERRGVQVNYTVYMPAKNPLDVTNEYGNTTLPALTGVVTANCSYGNFKADKLLNPNNKIKVAYGKANIASLQAANLDISYGGLVLESADKLDANVSYSSAKIGKLTGDGELNVRYCGGFKIDEIDKRIKSLNVNASYSSVSLGFQPAASLDFDVTVSYGGFNYGDDRVVVVSQSPDDNSRGPHFTKNYKGQIGKGSDAKVVVNSRYGSVHFN